MSKNVHNLVGKLCKKNIYTACRRSFIKKVCENGFDNVNLKSIWGTWNHTKKQNSSRGLCRGI